MMQFLLYCVVCLFSYLIYSGMAAQTHTLIIYNKDVLAYGKHNIQNSTLHSYSTLK